MSTSNDPIRTVLENIVQVCENRPFISSNEVLSMPRKMTIGRALEEIKSNQIGQLKTAFYQITVALRQDAPEKFYVSGLSLYPSFVDVKNLPQRFESFKQSLIQDLEQAGILYQEK
jgi:hypothetical protein